MEGSEVKRVVCTVLAGPLKGKRVESPELEGVLQREA